MSLGIFEARSNARYFARDCMYNCLELTGKGTKKKTWCGDAISLPEAKNISYIMLLFITYS